MNWQADVATFMREVKGLDLPARPEVPDGSVKIFCFAHIKEEVAELQKHIFGIDYVYEEDEIAAVADDIVDIIYVALQAANHYGLKIQPFWEEVQRANMAKKGGPIREDGKQLKPEGWTPPDILSIVRAQQDES